MLEYLSLKLFINSTALVDMCLHDANIVSSDVCWTVHHCDNWRIRDQLDATFYFIALPIGSTCFGHYYAHNQESASRTLLQLTRT